MSRSQSRRRETHSSENGDIKTTLDKVLKRLNVLDEKHEKLAKTITKKAVISQFVEAENVEEDWSNEGMNIYCTKDVKGANEMVV